jgi:FKBP-type peptidyl-prolyl cis-trans isomerase
LASLKNGQTAEILLPSRLAFGEIGSSNGFVPPYTPLIYEVKIIDVKKIK